MRQLVIRMAPDNLGVEVEGPINDKAACYAMLELAKDAIREYSEQQAKNKSPLVIATAMPRDGL